MMATSKRPAIKIKVAWHRDSPPGHRQGLEDRAALLSYPAGGSSARSAEAARDTPGIGAVEDHVGLPTLDH
jgi:hypothetical protein